MVETTQKSSGQKPSRWWRIVLTVSLALNLFFAGIISGHVFHFYKAEERFGMPFARAMARAQENLSPQDAAFFNATIERGAPQMNQDFRLLTEARQTLGSQLTAEHFDQDAARQAMAGMRAASDRLIDDFSATLVDALAGISPEGRQKLVKEFRVEHPPRGLDQ
jgi:uncharacterized membrane protein